MKVYLPDPRAITFSPCETLLYSSSSSNNLCHSLISEDCFTIKCMQESRRVLVDLLAVAKNRPDYWRKFCGNLGATSSSNILLAEGTGNDDALSLSPIVFLFAVACLLRGETQLIAFNLIDIALDDSASAKKQKEADQDTPEKILCLSLDDLLHFVCRFGCGGNTAQLRAVACSIASKICGRDDPSLAGKLFFSLIFDLTLGEMGKCHKELLGLLQSLALVAGPGRVDFASAAAHIELFWKAQMQAIRYDRSNWSYVIFEARSTRGPTQKKRFELSPCLFCQQARLIRKETEKGKTPSSSSSRSDGDSLSRTASRPLTGSSASAAVSFRPWHPDQVTTYSRGRLEGWRESSTSDEFNSYSSFKYRLILAEVHVEINDPRGRFVKTINVYINQRPVRDAATLKGVDFVDKWQRCGSIALPRGASRGSCKLDAPVVAANIKLEYAEFYERPGTSKVADGSFVVHCPRCTCTLALLLSRSSILLARLLMYYFVCCLHLQVPGL